MRDARRQARGAQATVVETDAVPACVRVGRVVEVWADGEVDPDVRGRPVWAITSTQRNYRAVAAPYFDEPLPGAAAWRASDHPDRLAERGYTVADLPALRADAQRRLRRPNGAHR